MSLRDSTSMLMRQISAVRDCRSTTFTAVIDKHFHVEAIATEVDPNEVADEKLMKSLFSILATLTK